MGHSLSVKTVARQPCTVSNKTVMLSQYNLVSILTSITPSSFVYVRIELTFNDIFVVFSVTLYKPILFYQYLIVENMGCICRQSWYCVQIILAQFCPLRCRCLMGMQQPSSGF